MNKIFCWFRNDILKTINYKKKIFPAVVINILCTHQSAATHKVSIQKYLLVFTWSFNYKDFWYFTKNLCLTLPTFEFQDSCTAKRKLERLHFSTSSSFFKIWSACSCEFKAYFWSFWTLYHLLFDLETIGVN